MAWNMLDNITSTGNAQTDLVNTLAAPAVAFTNFWGYLVLLPLFVILTMRSFFKQKEKEGKGNLWSSLAVSSFVTSLIALTMNLIDILTTQALGWIVGFTVLLVVIYILIKE